MLLARNRYGAVLTESALPDGGWLDVLEEVRRTALASDVIVTRPVVDARFWAEVLNLGGYDVLAQPFSEDEVRHVLENACSRIQCGRTLTARGPVTEPRSNPPARCARRSAPARSRCAGSVFP